MPTSRSAGHRDDDRKKKSNDEKKKKKNFFACLIIFFSLVADVTEVTRSARRYCNTGATLGRGGTQAYQALSRGLNNPLKLL